MDGIYQEKPKVANLGIQFFFEALAAQDCDCTQIMWMPPIKRSEEIEELLDDLL